MYDGFFDQRSCLAKGQLAEVSYEDLIRDPVNQLRRVYTELDLGGFESASPNIQERAESRSSYKTNSYDLDPELKDKIASRWEKFLDQYGYDREQ